MLLAKYNRLMNQRQYSAASALSSTELNKNQKAFFKSISGTLNHILIGDIIWLKRFSALPVCKEALSCFVAVEPPKSLNAILFQDFNELSIERKRVDEVIVDWIDSLTDDTLTQCLPYQNMAGKEFGKPLGSLIHHLFLHQVHHRGQVTTLLSQYGIDFGETDILEMIDEC